MENLELEPCDERIWSGLDWSRRLIAAVARSRQFSLLNGSVAISSLGDWRDGEVKRFRKQSGKPSLRATWPTLSPAPLAEVGVNA